VNGAAGMGFTALAGHDTGFECGGRCRLRRGVDEECG
jgi:hypothetical protein